MSITSRCLPAGIRRGRACSVTPSDSFSSFEYGPRGVRAVLYSIRRGWFDIGRFVASHQAERPTGGDRRYDHQADRYPTPDLVEPLDLHVGQGGPGKGDQLAIPENGPAV